MRSRAVRLSAALAALPFAALAQSTIFKVQYPDGSIGFTDKPPANAKILESREPGRDVNVIPPPAKPASLERGGARAGAPSALDAAQDEVLASQKALDEAKQRREVGREPQPGERIGLAGGGTRVSPAYEARQKTLEDAVAAAEARLKQAYEDRNAAR